MTGAPASGKLRDVEQVRAVIFDFNGVLVDDEHVHCELLRAVLAEEGIFLTDEEYHARYLGYDDRGCFEVALGEAGQDASRARVESLIARKAARYAAAAETGLRIFPGAADCVRSLAARWPLAICSGALRAEIEFALDRLECRDLVPSIIAAEDTTRCKPDPQGYLLALDALRARTGADLEPAHCLVIEDSLAGVESAKAARMLAVAVLHTYTDPELRAAGADAVVPTLADITPDWAAERFGAARAEVTGLLLSRDLLFTSKITGTARELGRRVLVAGNTALATEMIGQWRPTVVFVDLAAGSLVSVPALTAFIAQAGPGTTFIAFGSHVDTDALAAAKAAGCNLVLPRSRFTTELAGLIQKYMG
ncbi:MAG: HAD family phosphatase [Isosphaeraceae bacterium]|nr:HAD family phosphatase [Isosphaeraceae bacterium]